MLTTSAGAAGHPVHVNRAAGRERIASLDAFELIREQAHEALSAIRSRCREDHNRILNRLGAHDAIPPPYADEPLAEAATPPLRPRLSNAGWDANTRMKISRALAEAPAEAPNEMAWSNGCADELLDNEQPRTGNEASFAVVVDDEQPADGGSIEDRLQVEIDADDSTDYPDGPLEETQPFAGSRHRRRARDWSLPRWPMSRLQTMILALLVVDCILVGWRAEIVRALPQTSSFYKLAGLSVNLRGLAFDGVATTTEQHEGVPVLVVEGNIINSAPTVADVPRLKFIVRDAGRQEIYSWTAVPSRMLLPPGEAVSFRTELASPPPDTHDVLLRFVDHRDIVAAER